MIHLIHISAVQDWQSIGTTIETRAEDDNLTDLIPDPFGEKIVNQAGACYRRGPSTWNAPVGYFFHELQGTREARK